MTAERSFSGGQVSIVPIRATTTSATAGAAAVMPDVSFIGAADYLELELLLLRRAGREYLRAWGQLDIPGGGTDTHSGTSYASPAVAGAAALVLATTPALSGNPAGLFARMVNRAALSVDVSVGCGVAETDRPLLDANASVQP